MRYEDIEGDLTNHMLAVTKSNDQSKVLPGLSALMGPLSQLHCLLEFTKAILRAVQDPAQTRQKKAQITNMAYDTTKKIEALKSSVFIVTTKTARQMPSRRLWL